jgi:hypothetical protein
LGGSLFATKHVSDCLEKAMLPADDVPQANERSCGMDTLRPHGHNDNLNPASGSPTTLFLKE